MIEKHQVIIRPLVNEKSVLLRDQLNQYAFEVHWKASKPEVKAAVEHYFNVKVVDVHTLITHGKVKRVGQTMGRRHNWKKAIVTLVQGNRIDLFAAA